MSTVHGRVTARWGQITVRWGQIRAWAGRAALPLFVLGLALGLGCQRDSPVAQLPKDPTPVQVEADPGSAQPEAKAGSAPAKAEVSAKRPSSSSAAATGRLLLTGTTEAYRRSTLAPKVAGTVQRVLVREGSVVKEGQPLVLLDPSDFRLGLRQARAARKVTQAQLEATRIEWKRLSGLIKEKAVPRSKYDQVDAQLQVGQAGLAQADVAVAMANKELRDATVRAPFDGIVTEIEISRGEYAAMTPPTELLTIEQIDTLDLRVQVPERAIARVKKGTRLRVRFRAVGRTLEAAVTRVIASLDARSRSFAAIVELENRDRQLRPGMFAEVRLVAGPEARAGGSAR